MICEAADDSFRRDVFLKALKALDYFNYVIPLYILVTSSVFSRDAAEISTCSPFPLIFSVYFNYVPFSFYVTPEFPAFLHDSGFV